ncbi:LacI family DNA-binding transcriptional regulator [Paenibacillus filicis]|uniref:LacI family DNA-binding transcriptional regulator n=1 Tax=Paenibacillus filicis TaxID=669464 RepID=A0ABU9DHM3_9BACL
MRRKKKVTLQHIADQLGLTIQTVSKALKGKSGMSEETRSEIVKTAQQLGYLTHDQQRTLVYDRIAAYPLVKRRFVLLQNEQSLNFNRLLLAGLHDRFSEFGHWVEPMLIPSNLTPQSYPQWLENSGILFAEGVFLAPRLSHDGIEELLLQVPVPRILLNFPPPESRVDSVIWDVYEAVYQSVRYFKRMGHSRIMYVGDTVTQRGFRLRWQAFQEAMLEVNDQVDPSQHVLNPYEVNRSSWVQHFIAKYTIWKPTAILCSIDEQVAPVYYALQEAGVRVPQDCSLIGILNEQSDQLPSMTRPLLPIKDTGYRAADRMLWRIANPHLPFEHIRIRGEFYAGGSTSSL